MKQLKSANVYTLAEIKSVLINQYQLPSRMVNSHFDGMTDPLPPGFYLTDEDVAIAVKSIQKTIDKKPRKGAAITKPQPLMKSAITGKPVSSVVPQRQDALITIGASWPNVELGFEPDSDPLEDHEQVFSGKRGVERVYADALAAKLNGRREVPVPTGFIDVLTDSEIIEVKYALCWKHAIGQVQMYGLYYPLLAKRIHLFGELTQEKFMAITQWCRQAAITVTWEK